MEKLRNCPACGVKPGRPHKGGCDIEMCSACGKQQITCRCKGKHDAMFARWTGIFPGFAESRFLGITLNDFTLSQKRAFFIKPTLKKKKKQSKK